MKNGSANVPMNIVLKQIVKTTAEWAQVQSVIPQDVLCIEVCADGVRLQKLGNGVGTWAQLPYMIDTMVGASTETTYELVVEEPVPFDPTAYYKLVDESYVPGEAGDAWAADTWYTQVTSGVAGKRGLVPTPGANDKDKFLKGDGTWATVATIDTQYRITYDSAATALDAFTLQSNDGTGWVDVTDVNLNLFNESTTIIRSALLPSYVDDIVEGYFYENAFYEDEEHTVPITGESGKIYVDIDTNSTYRCVPADPEDPESEEVWVNISNPLSAEAICDLLGITYANDATIGDMVGADGTNAGVHGFVPAPAATDNTKFFKGDGTFGDALEPTDNLTLQCVLAFE